MVADSSSVRIIICSVNSMAFQPLRQQGYKGGLSVVTSTLSCTGQEIRLEMRMVSVDSLSHMHGTQHRSHRNGSTHPWSQQRTSESGRRKIQDQLVGQTQSCPFTRREGELSVEDGCLLWGTRVIVPPQLRSKVVA